MLVNSVLLRQNPHNVQEWLKRIELFQKEVEEDAKSNGGEQERALMEKIALTYTEAVTTVDPQKASGKPHTLWINFAKFYETNEVWRVCRAVPCCVGFCANNAVSQSLDEARQIFEKAVQASYKSVDHLATVWCEYAEMELRHKNYKQALSTSRLSHCCLPLGSQLVRCCARAPCAAFAVPQT